MRCLLYFKLSAEEASVTEITELTGRGVGIRTLVAENLLSSPASVGMEKWGADESSGWIAVFSSWC